MITLENGNLAETSGLPRVFEFGPALVRTFTDAAGEPWFVAADVCRVLEIGNPSDAVASLDDDEKATLANTEGQAGRGAQAFKVITESGLYSLILRSRKPEARAFKRWVTHEVLPALRKTGRFSVQAAPLALPTTYAEALRALAQEVEEADRLRAQAAQMEPKAAFFDAVTSSQDTISLGDTAKLLGTGRNRLMAALREKGVLQASNVPYQRFIDAGYFRVTESKWEDLEGASHVTLTTRVYQRGVEYVRGLLQIEAVVKGGVN